MSQYDLTRSKIHVEMNRNRLADLIKILAENTVSMNRTSSISSSFLAKMDMMASMYLKQLRKLNYDVYNSGNLTLPLISRIRLLTGF